MFESIHISSSGLATYKKMMEVTSNNIANIQTTRGEGGVPYRRQAVILEERKIFDSILKNGIGGGVQIREIIQDNTVEPVYDPEHPDANENGYVMMPKINLTAEMTNLLAEQRAYEANASAFSANAKILEKELEIGKY